MMNDAVNSSPEDDSSSTNDSVLAEPVIVQGLLKSVKYHCPWTTWSYPKLMDIITWMMTSIDNSEIPPQMTLNEELPVMKPDFTSDVETGIHVTWLGHATVLVQMDGINILTDPHFSERASAVSFLGPKRYRPVPCKVQDLPEIHAVVISHNHYDHLDYPSVKMLNARFGDNLYWYVPTGLKKWMKDSHCSNVVELSWWKMDEIPTFNDVKFIFTPTQHWCNRGIFDINKVLWGSWCILTPHHRFFFAGDTGYCDVFTDIGKKFGPFDLAAIPIGAYEPRWFMSPQHVDPEQAVQIHQDIKSKQSIAIHWGTFPLANEHYLDPKEHLQQALSRGGLPSEAFITLKHGETKVLF